MTFGFVALVFAFGAGVFTAAVCFVYFNRKSPDKVDAVEAQVRRDFRR